MAITQESFVLNEFGLTERKRTTSRGTKSRYSVTIDAQPIVHDFSGTRLGDGPAEAMRDVLERKVRAVSGNVSQATILFRKHASNALASGARWAMRRYGGGRTGVKQPNQSGDALFNDSGRLAQGFYVRQNTTEKSWTVNVPANRLDPSTFRSQAEFQAMAKRLQTAVPELGDPRAMVAAPEVRTAIRSSMHDLIHVLTLQRNANRAKLLRAIAGVVRGLV